MTENRRQVLEMLSTGHITADEADRLITALEEGHRPASPPARSDPQPLASPRYLRVLADVEDDKDGPVKINIRVPLQLLRAGVRLASLIPAAAQGDVDKALRERGLPFDLSQIKPENLDELITELRDLTVDVDGEKGNVRVRVFCE